VASVEEREEFLGEVGAVLRLEEMCCVRQRQVLTRQAVIVVRAVGRSSDHPGSSPPVDSLVPLYLMLVDANQVDTLTGLVIMYLAGAVFCFFLIQGYMSSMPYVIIEAARIDGAGVVKFFWRIVLPLIRPILVTVGVFQTMWVWNDFITPNVFISSPEKRTIVLQVYSAVGEFTTDWPAFMTVSVLALIPMVIFFVFTQRHIVSGLLAGGIKG